MQSYSILSVLSLHFKKGNTSNPSCYEMHISRACGIKHWMLAKPPANMLLTLGSECKKEHEQAISQVDFAPCPAILHQGGGMRDRGGIRKNIYTTYGVLEQMDGNSSSKPPPWCRVQWNWFSLLVRPWRGQTTSWYDFLCQTSHVVTCRLLIFGTWCNFEPL